MRLNFKAYIDKYILFINKLTELNFIFSHFVYI